jgi:hypothetical protein
VEAQAVGEAVARGPNGEVIKMLNDENAIERFEFLEALVRLAVAKFLKAGPSAPGMSVSVAVQRLLDEFVLPRANRYEPSPQVRGTLTAL